MSVKPFLNSLAQLFTTVGRPVSKKVISPAIDLISHIAKQIFSTFYSSVYLKLQKNYFKKTIPTKTRIENLANPSNIQANIQSISASSLYNHPVGLEKRQFQDSPVYEHEERSNEKASAENLIKEFEKLQQQIMKASVVVERFIISDAELCRAEYLKNYEIAHLNQAIELYAKAASLGSVEGAYQQGRLLWLRYETTQLAKDLEEGYRALLKAANAGSKEAMAEISEEYEYAVQIPYMKNIMQQLSDTPFGSPDFYTKKGVLLEALIDHPSRWLTLFYLLVTEEGQFSELIPTVLTEWNDLAAFTSFSHADHPLFVVLQGKEDSMSCVIAGICREKGWGVKQDVLGALEAYEKAADQQDAVGVYHQCRYLQTLASEPMSFAEVEDLFRSFTGHQGLGAANLLLAEMAEAEGEMEKSRQYTRYACMQGMAEAQLREYSQAYLEREEPIQDKAPLSKRVRRFLDVNRFLIREEWALAEQLEADPKLEHAYQQKYPLAYLHKADRCVINQQYQEAEALYGEGMLQGSVESAIRWADLSWKKGGKSLNASNKRIFLRLTKDVERIPEDMVADAYRLRSLFFRRHSKEYFSAQIGLANCYLEGIGGVEKDISKAKELLAAIQTKSVEAAHLLGKQYEVEENIGEALLCYLDAVKLGSPQELYRLLDGLKTESLWRCLHSKAIVETICWQLDLARQGNGESARFVAQMFATTDESRRQRLHDPKLGKPDGNDLQEWASGWKQIAKSLEQIDQPGEGVEKRGEAYYYLVTLSNRDSSKQGKPRLDVDISRQFTWLQEAALSGHMQAAIEWEHRVNGLDPTLDWFVDGGYEKIRTVLQERHYVEHLQKAVRTPVDPAACLHVAETLDLIGKKEASAYFFAKAKEAAMADRNWEVLWKLSLRGEELSQSVVMGVSVYTILKENRSKCSEEYLTALQKTYQAKLELCQKDDDPELLRGLTELAERLERARTLKTVVEELDKALKSWAPSDSEDYDGVGKSLFCYQAGRVLVSKNAQELLGDYRKEGCALLQKAASEGNINAGKLLFATTEELSYLDSPPDWLGEYEDGDCDLQ